MKFSFVFALALAGSFVAALPAPDEANTEVYAADPAEAAGVPTFEKRSDSWGYDGGKDHQYGGYHKEHHHKYKHAYKKAYRKGYKHGYKKGRKHRHHHKHHHKHHHGHDWHKEKDYHKGGYEGY